MKKNDIVRVSVMGRKHLAKIDDVSNKVHLTFINGNVPSINGHKRRKVALSKDLFEPYDKSGINWTVRGLK